MPEPTKPESAPPSQLQRFLREYGLVIGLLVIGGPLIGFVGRQYGLTDRARAIGLGTAGLVVVAVTTQVIRARRRWFLANTRRLNGLPPASKPTRVLDEVNWAQVETHLRYSADRMRNAANVVLFGVLAAVGLSLAFYWVSSTSAQDAEAEDRALRFSDLSAARTQLAEAQEHAANVPRMLETTSTVISNRGPATDQEVAKQLGATAKFRNDAVVTRTRDVAEAQKRVEEALRPASVSPGSIIALISRLAIGVLLVFTVRILASIYRYSTRMSAFYQGRADALMVAKSPRTEQASTVTTVTSAKAEPATLSTASAPPAKPSGGADVVVIADADSLVPRTTATREERGVTLKDLVDWFSGDKLHHDPAVESPTGDAVKLVKTALSGAVDIAKSMPKA